MKHKIKKKVRDRLWFDAFTYCIVFQTTRMSALRTLNPKHVTNSIEFARNTNINFGGSWLPRQSTLAVNWEKVKETLYALCEFFLDITQEHKLTISYNRAYLYVNSLDCIKDFNIPGVDIVFINQADVILEKDTMLIRNSKHKLRTYFKEQHINMHQKTSLQNLLENQSGIRMGPGLMDFFYKWPQLKYVGGNYFVDHNDETLLTMLSLVSTIKIKRTVKLLRDK